MTEDMLRAWVEERRERARFLYIDAEHQAVEEYNRGRRDAFDEVLAALDAQACGGPGVVTAGGTLYCERSSGHDGPHSALGTTWGALDDVRDTQKFPPIRETVLRRPPPPAVRELTGPELLRALAREIESDPDL